MSEVRIIGVIQARLGSSRLPRKVVATIGDRPLVLWTIEAMLAVGGLDGLVLATTQEALDDELIDVVGDRVAIHRGPVHDVLTRCWDAVQPLAPTIVVRQTADNPFVDPKVVEAQIEQLIAGSYDFVGYAGWPLGIAAEVVRADVLGVAAREAVDPAEREHVMPFVYSRPERFRIGSLPIKADPIHMRYTVDTLADLAFARAVAGRLGHAPPVALAELEEIIRREPSIGAINADVRQKTWHEIDDRSQTART